MKRRRGSAVAHGLAAAVGQVLAEYRGFLRQADATAAPEEAKEFGARHAAARSALAHLEQLLKLTGEKPEEDTGRNGQALLLDTRRVIPAASPIEAKEATEGDGPSP
ncbi:hypothetical protein GCM10011504_07750 [Siccirubricoccus deserti]|uniref:Uncharacterized protein n=1 Tax=Siccirubricoccus deserti TaxID=2013562 RepID=A0A9X0QW22_9PROT|nr:hypothetical protein [Siccirubricoccus deserti]MBC4014550.1 hypothetical protein [Siccirubricoccus deserti]GGC31962.1 hypothetical protein GCM10011504_07750 [Siccirubricoccus deserti]